MGNYTINDIARISGFSRGTVSRVLNRDKNVSPETRAKIEKTIRDLHYHPNALARGLVNGKMDMVALIMGDVRNPFFSDIAFDIQNIMRENGYMVVLFNSTFNESIEKQSIRAAQRMGFRGIFLISCVVEADDYRELQSDACPIVLLHRIIRRFSGDFVVQDDYHAGYLVTNHLIEMGYDRIAFLCGPHNSLSSVSRVEGFRRAMANAMLPVEEDFLFEGDFSMEKGYAFGKEYARDFQEKPRAVLCGNDMMAIGMMEAFKEDGVRIPENVSVASFDDIDMARWGSIQLTTVHQPVLEMCQRACQIMVGRITGQQLPVSRVMLVPKLVVRRTTARFTGYSGR